VILSEEGGISRLPYPAIRRWTDRVKQIPDFTAMAGVFGVSAAAPATPWSSSSSSSTATCLIPAITPVTRPHLT
jgi:hypothetical protein